LMVNAADIICNGHGHRDILQDVQRPKKGSRMLQINQIKIPVEKTFDNKQEIEACINAAARKLNINKSMIYDLTIQKKSMDARKKPILYYVYSITCSVKNEREILKKKRLQDVTIAENSEYIFTVSGEQKYSHRPVIIGMGPAGLFCGYILAKYGYKPILFERGKKVEERIEDVSIFWGSGKLHKNSNVQFGEGGAGTFSDGKLNTLIKDKTGRNKEVLRILVENGAPKHILYDNKPHIGTDILSKTVINMREKMLGWGAEIYYESQITGMQVSGDVLTGLVINNEKTIKTETVVLAIGHSARDTFEMLYSNNVPMESKDFAVGFRVQHPQEYIDYSQYGRKNEDKQLPAASYKLAAKTSVDRGVYSFCMCPGGYVVNASSEEKRLAVNGMSYSGRNSLVANSAIIMSVTRKDYPSDHPLAGVAFQRNLEEKAYSLGNGAIPIQYYCDFSGNDGKKEYIKDRFEPCIKGAYQFSDLRDLLPEELNTAFVDGMTQFGKMIPGFDDDYCILAGVESRTSSPVRINRDSFCESAIKGLYPCGEGAGYAGGITSAAMDGLAVAEAIAKRYCP